METDAVLLSAPRRISVDSVRLTPPGPTDAIIEIRHSAISTGTEKLFWTGEMPPFPGMGYPLVPGYEAMGEVMEAGPDSGMRPGQVVFVPGASCYDGAHGLFGGSARRIVSDGRRLTPLDPGTGPEGALLALAATARHAIAGSDRLPDLIVGHGVLGRLLARLTVIAGGSPTVWETDPARRGGDHAYTVVDPATDTRNDYTCIVDASGDAGLLDDLIGRIARGGEIVLAGFYTAPVSFAFPPAFMKEARLRIAAEWDASDIVAIRALLEGGTLGLADLVTHSRPAHDAPAAYETAFTDPACLKMTLDWTAR